MNSNIAQAYKNIFTLMTAMPGVRLDARKGLTEQTMAVKGFDEITYRLNINLSDAVLLAAGATTQRGGASDWWINEDRVGSHVGCALDVQVHFEDNTRTAPVIGVDPVSRRVLTTDGRIYQLGRRLVAPIAVSYATPPKQKLMISADLLADDQELAAKYVEKRHDDAVAFYKSLKWETARVFEYCVQTEVYGVRIVHEMKDGMLHAGATWGELFFDNQPGRDPIIFHTFDNFVAYMLATYW